MLLDDQRRVVIIDIPAHSPGKLLKFYDIPLDRSGEDLIVMNDDRQREILNAVSPDWSSQICSKASIDDLDKKAINIARKNFKKKNPKLSKKVDEWSDKIFLNKAKLTIKDKVTNCAIILLGKPEASALISPAVAQITWILKDESGQEKDYEHFHTPLLLAVNQVYSKIRNLKYRYIKEESLFPEEVDMYAPSVIREALHNCIAHQDYSLQGRIQLIENEKGFLIFTNKGDFLPGSVEAVIQADSPQEHYRNKYLADAMVNLTMIDTVGSGIKTMYLVQKERYFPLPSYDISGRKVSVKIFGKMLDINYARILAKNDDLSLKEIMLLDQVQKGHKITKDGVKILRDKNLIEGRYPNIHISKKVAEKAGEKVRYIRDKGMGDTYYKDLIVEYLSKYPGATREDINNLLIDKLSEILTEQQKLNKIRNLLYDLSKRDGRIVNNGTNRKPKWINK